MLKQQYVVSVTIISMNSKQANEVIEKLKNGGVGVIPTDTIYGIVALVRFKDSVERIYNIKGRHSGKPFIFLISDVSQLSHLGIHANEKQLAAARKQWPGPVSVILPCPEPTLQYAHRGMDTLAVRLPRPAWLKEIISQVGPIAATSANLAGQPTPDNIKSIKQQLPGLDFYIEGRVSEEASKLIRVKTDGTIERLR